MKILVADKLSVAAIDALTELGAEVHSEADLGEGDLPGKIGDAEVLIVRSTRVKSDTIDAATNLSLLIRAGAGVNTIDLAACSRRGIYVCNCPGKNTAAVAELAIGLMIAADRRIVDATTALRAGSWQKKEFGKAAGLKDRTLGILGLGAIGTAVARAALGLDMRVLAWSRSLTPQRARELEIERADSALAVAAEADVVSIHLAMSDDTRHLVDQAFLSRLKPGAILVNTSRGELVDSAALREAVLKRGLKVAVDVFENEPTGGTDAFDQTELAALITATPHIGASTEQAAAAIADEVVRIVREFHTTGHPPGAVNLCRKSPATHQLVVRHFNRIGVLARVMDGLRAEHVNVEEMDNVIFDGAHAACCSLRLDQSPSAELLDALRGDENILAVSLTASD